MIGDSFIMGRTNWWYLVTDLEVVGVSDFSDGDPLPPSANALDWVDSRLAPNSLLTTPVATRQFPQLAPSTSTSSQAVPSTHSTTLPSPRIRKPRFSSRMGSLSPSSFNSNSNIIHNNNNTIIPPSPPITPISRSTPILIRLYIFFYLDFKLREF